MATDEETAQAVAKLKDLMSIPWVRRAMELDATCLKLGLDIAVYKEMTTHMAGLWRQAQDKEALRSLLSDCITLVFEIGPELEKMAKEQK